jgi:DNA-binding IclR family transcriptional regulator
MAKEKADPWEGTQSIARAIALLRIISARGSRGAQLTDVAKRCDLHKSTAHRIISCLVREGLVKQRLADGRYVAGPSLFELGLSQFERSDLQYAARTRLAALARQTGAVAYLMLRSGDDCVCATRVGNPRSKVCGFPGARKPLVLSAGGVAILLALPDAEASEIIERNIRLFENDVEKVRSVRFMLKRSWAEGFGVSEGNVREGINAFGVSLRDTAGSPFASLVVAGPTHALSYERRGEMRQLLQEAAKGLGATPS